MKRVSLGGLDVSRLGLGAMGTSALAENTNRGDHALLLSL
jgi:aryl-alcohol dehydrogenase-like predicted oxidoreductase